MVNINTGPSHQHTPFIVDDRATSGRTIAKVDRQPVVRVFTASYTRCPSQIWVSTHAHFGAFPPSSFLHDTPSRKHTTIPRPTSSMGAGFWPSDRECGSPPNVKPTTTLFRLVRLHCLFQQSLVHLVLISIPTYQWLPSQYIRLPTVASDVTLPACMDRPDADTHILSLAIGTRTRRSDQFTRNPSWRALLPIHVQPQKWRRHSISPYRLPIDLFHQLGVLLPFVYLPHRQTDGGSTSQVVQLGAKSEGLPHHDQRVAG